MLRSVAPGSPPDDPVRRLGPCSTPSRMLQSGASFRRILSVALDAPVGAPGSPPDDPVRGLGPSSTPPRMLQSGASRILLSLLSLALLPHSARSFELALRAVGPTRAPGGDASYLGVGRSGSGALPPPTTRPFERAAGARFPLAVGAVCGRRGPAVLGTLSRAAVRRVLCALSGFAAPGGRCGLAPVLVPWLWPAVCLSGVPRGPALVRRSPSGPVALGAPVGFPVAVVPSPTPGAVAPGFTGWLRGARGGRPRTGLIVPAAGPCRGKGAGRAPRRTRSGPRDGVVPGGSLRLRSWAACAAVVRRVWTRSLTRPVSRTVRLPTGDSAGAPGLSSCGRRHRPFRARGRHARVLRVCLCVLFLAGCGGPASQQRFGAPHLSFGRSWCALCLFGPLRAGVAPFVVVVGFFFFSFLFPFPPLVAPPLCPALRVFRPRVPWASASCRLPSPFFFPPPPPLCAPLSPGFRVFRPGVPWASAS